MLTNAVTARPVPWPCAKCSRIVASVLAFLSFAGQVVRRRPWATLLVLALLFFLPSAAYAGPSDLTYSVSGIHVDATGPSASAAEAIALIANAITNVVLNAESAGMLRIRDQSKTKNANAMVTRLRKPHKRSTNTAIAIRPLL